MNVYIESITYFIVTCFPLILNLFYAIYNKALGNEEKKLYEDIILIIITYLLIISEAKYINLIISMPLLFSILKNKNITFIILLIFETFYLSLNSPNLSILILESILLILLLKINNLKKIKTIFITILFIIIKSSLFYINNNFNQLETLKLIIIFIPLTLLYFYIYQKSHLTTKLFKSIKDVEENEQIRKSIFKISHEIKNPLAVCKGYLDMYDNSDKEKTEKYVSIIKDEIDKTLLILQDFLSLTKTTLKKEVMDVNCLVEDCLDNLDLLLKNKKVELIKDLIDDEIYISADYNRLHQVLVNVIKNSIEALEDRDKKTINIRVSFNKKYVFIVVEDNGPGLDKETLENIKKPFYTTKKNGTGLGVPLSIEIINAHNGEMKFETIPNRKTSVTISLPIEKGINNF